MKPEVIATAIELFWLIAIVLIPSAIFVTYISRKLVADLQARVGPSEIGVAGFFQVFADVVKLIDKRTVRTSGVRGLKERFLWTLILTGLFLSLAILPVGSAWLIVDVDMSAFVPLISALAIGLCAVLLGIEMGEERAILSGIRVASQVLSGLLPAILTLIAAGVHSGGYSWSRFAEAQGAFPLHWTVANHPPFQLIGFFVFFISGLILFQIAPFQTAFGRADLKGGLSQPLSGYRHLIFRFSQFFALFLWSAVTVTIYLGAWKLPAFLDFGGVITHVLETVWLLSKTYLLMLILAWIDSVVPRIRVDQVSQLGWHFLSPAAVVVLIGACVLAALGVGHG